MVQKPWFKLFVWFMATFFFFMASGVAISLLSPGPSETDVMRFMSGMMGAMESSIMGVSMAVENNNSINKILAISYFILPPTIIISIVIGFSIRFLRGSGKIVQ